MAVTQTIEDVLNDIGIKLEKTAEVKKDTNANVTPVVKTASALMDQIATVSAELQKVAGMDEGTADGAATDQILEENPEVKAILEKLERGEITEDEARAQIEAILGGGGAGAAMPGAEPKMGSLKLAEFDKMSELDMDKVAYQVGLNDLAQNLTGVCEHGWNVISKMAGETKVEANPLEGQPTSTGTVPASTDIKNPVGLAGVMKDIEEEQKKNPAVEQQATEAARTADANQVLDTPEKKAAFLGLSSTTAYKAFVKGAAKLQAKNKKK